jgi:hypothetical protein
MGWLVRHIRNRNLAGENLAMGMAKKALIRRAPAHIQANIVKARGDKVDKASYVRSALGSAAAIMYGAGGRVGSGMVTVHPNRKNCKKVVVGGTRSVADAICKIKGPWTRDRLAQETVLKLTKGVKVDGHSLNVSSGYCQLALLFFLLPCASHPTITSQV